MIENSTQGLTVLDADLDVEVLDPDPAALAAWAPGPGQHARRVAAELAAVGDARGGQWIEVRIDGVPVGGLPAAAAQRHARHIDAVLDRGGRPAANGLVRPGPRLELRLPHPASPVRAPLPPAGPPADRPDALGLFEPLPEERPRSRTPLLVGAGVLALLLAVGVVIGVRPAGEPAASGPAVIRITTPAPVPTTSPLTAPPEAPVAVRAESEPEAEAETEAETVTAPTRARRPPRPAPRPPTCRRRRPRPPRSRRRAHRARQPRPPDRS
jgi:hypothetical protein